MVQDSRFNANKSINFQQLDCHTFGLILSSFEQRFVFTSTKFNSGQHAFFVLPHHNLSYYFISRYVFLHPDFVRIYLTSPHTVRKYEMNGKVGSIFHYTNNTSLQIDTIALFGKTKVEWRTLVSNSS